LVRKISRQAVEVNRQPVYHKYKSSGSQNPLTTNL